MLMLPALILISHLLAAQSNISGVVNSYYKVIQVIPAKACVRLNTTIGLGYNDKAMIVQMKGVSINTASSTSSSFGDTTALNDAGNYEIGTICSINGDSVFFDYMFLNNYTISGQVQLVRIPEYYSATVVDTLKAAPWNNATGTGGVLAIFINQDLVLNKPISADTVGYRRGAYRLSGGTCTNTPGATAYAYNPTSVTQNGAYKGEGASDVVIAQAGGRGAPANGGGGGNNHNNGGGGGANLAAGGDGGGNSSSSGCSLSIQGKGGKALSSYGGKKIFMGGGGGAGHANNGFAASNGGGHGGGIVFIRALNIIGNGYKISANGQTGGPALSDGASGGGAGGTIILSASSYTGPLTVSANGGQGGTEDDGGNINKCYGSGGGGSGGIIYFSGSVPGGITATANGGNAGPEINHDVSCNAAVASSPGLAGQVVTSYTFRSSLVLSNSYCTTLLPVELVWFNAYYNAGKVDILWKMAQPELVDHFVIERSNDAMHWSELYTMAADAVKTVYSYEDLSPAPGNNFYRIKIIRKNNAASFSIVRKVIVPQGNEVIAIYPNPASKKIFVSGLNSSSEFMVFDQTGKLILEKKIVAMQHIIEVDLPDLPKGVYLIRVGDTVKRLSIY
ncbi:MAG TPA: T9SS type A sorting domain-containing protein [Chitinophagaceae bacterium]|nr:T9SS type A sorting domain-containing protein [Chitinophagaceae bacterium]